jgi:hypothetical protein
MHRVRLIQRPSACRRLDVSHDILEDSFKSIPQNSDPPPMAKDVICPTCDGPLLIDGDESVGDEVFCGNCAAVYKVTSVDVEGCQIEEDF